MSTAAVLVLVQLHSFPAPMAHGAMTRERVNRGQENRIDLATEEDYTNLHPA